MHLLQKVQTFEQNGDVYIFLILPKYIYFFNWHCPSEATENSYMLPRRQNKSNLPRFSNLHPPTFILMQRFSFSYRKNKVDR